MTLHNRSDFFVVGGTLQTTAPSYVTRPADQELFRSILEGQFCYVLTARQMGKSSLMQQTAARLRQQGVNVVRIDLTMIGVSRTSIDQWYVSLLTYVQRELGLTVDAEDWWRKHSALSVLQRFTSYLRDIVLTEVSNSIAICIDEIDSTLNLDFRDDFFAAIRAIYNARASDPVYRRLTFVLLGVATPTDLIKDLRRTPFNIGRRIVLEEFSYQDARPLQHGIEQFYPGYGDHILRRIFYWTNGHPYLTQKLCLAAVQAPGHTWDDTQVDRLVERLFLAENARKDANLAFVEDRIRSGTPLERRGMLKLYKDVYVGKVVLDDSRSRIQNDLELVGLIRVERGHLQVRNRIYQQAFNQDWIVKNIPVNPMRIVAISVGLILLLLLATLIVFLSQR